MYRNYNGQFTTEEILSVMSAYELGESGIAQAVPHLAKYLISENLNDKRLAASAVKKLTYYHRINCQSLKDLLMKNFREHDSQVRQYTLKALQNLELSSYDVMDIYFYGTEEKKNYNRSIITKILSEN
ncbi:MAG: HEAT repeat domain-containing protein [Fusobacteriaceae bacterium]